MILKDYQAQAIRNLEDFLKLLDENKPISEAFKNFWASRDVNAKPPYQNNIPHVPQVCFKVPTGGGKTFMAASSLKVIFDALPATQSKVVVWLVPSDTILTQTYKNLSDSNHPYHRSLDADFSSQIAVYTKEQLLAAENFSPTEVNEQLSILVLSYDSFRTSNKEGRKAYQQNGQLNQFVSHFHEGEEILSGADESSLIQVIRHYRPVIIVDESHHATTNLSIEMLQNFNPSFILELTATPKDTSNVIAYVPAAKLKDNGMVKLPVIVYNRHTQDDVITDAIDFRNLLERVGQDENIRPIILFQAESQGRGDRITFDRIKAELIQNHNIPSEQIAIKTADINDLKNLDLMESDCQIRYIITINALKEGWDCPFAYILASLANRTSTIDVEQILGRILRRPFTKNFSNELLNMSYVFTSSADFRQTLDKIVIGLNAAGFSEHEYRAITDSALEHALEQTPTHETLNLFDTPASAQSDAIEINLAKENSSPQSSNNPYTNNSLADIQAQAIQANQDYQTDNSNPIEICSIEERERMSSFAMRDYFKSDALTLVLPQFFIREDTGSNFEGVTDLKVNKDMFRTNFSLADKDTVINFDNLNYEIVSLDVHDKEDFPRYKYLSDSEIRAFLEYFDNLPPEGQIRQCVAKIVTIIDKGNNPPSQDISTYVTKIVSNFDRERIREAVQHTGVYAKKIKDKINTMLTTHAKNNFLAQIDSRKIFTKPSFKLPTSISPTRFQKTWDNSLYVAEEEVNNLEYRLASRLTALDNVLWWHRNRSKKEFCLNGFINHYPDFIVRMKSGFVLLVEAKGDDRDNSDSKQKLELGKIWESKAGSDSFGYFMVFDSNPLDNALSLDNFMARIKEL